MSKLSNYIHIKIKEECTIEKLNNLLSRLNNFTIVIDKPIKIK